MQRSLTAQSKKRFALMPRVPDMFLSVDRRLYAQYERMFALGIDFQLQAEQARVCARIKRPVHAIEESNHCSALNAIWSSYVLIATIMVDCFIPRVHRGRILLKQLTVKTMRGTCKIPDSDGYFGGCVHMR